MSSTTSPSKSMNVAVGTAIVAWVGTFAVVHGPFVFGYVAMHAATTGVFLLAIRRNDRASENRQSSPNPARATASMTMKRPTSERVARTQPVA